MAKLLSSLKCGMCFNFHAGPLQLFTYWAILAVSRYVAHNLASCNFHHRHNIATKLRDKMYESHGFIAAASYVTYHLYTIGQFVYIRKKPAYEEELRWHFLNMVFKTTDLRPLFFNSTEYSKYIVNTGSHVRCEDWGSQNIWPFQFLSSTEISVLCFSILSCLTVTKAFNTSSLIHICINELSVVVLFFFFFMANVNFHLAFSWSL